MKILKRLSCFIVATCMAISCVACSSGDTTWAFEYDDITIGSGLYIGMTISAYIQASSLVTDYTQDVIMQYVEDIPAKEWIVNKTEEIANRFIAIEKEFDRLGLELSQEDITAVDEELRVLWNSAGSVYEANGVSRNSYRLILENSKKEAALFDGYYGEGGTDEVSTKDIFSFFEDEYAVINALSIAKEFSFDDAFLPDEGTDSDEDTDTDLDEDSDGDSTDLGFASTDVPYSRAVEFADRINAGEDFNRIVAEYSAELEAIAEAEAEAQAQEDGLDWEFEELTPEEYEAYNNSMSTDDEDEDADSTDDEDEDADSTDDEDEDADSTDDEDEDADSTDDEDEDTDSTDDEEEEEIEYEYEDDHETKFAFSRSNTSVDANFIDAVFDMPKDAVAEVIEDTSVYYVIVRYDVTDKDAIFTDMNDSILAQMKNDEFTEIIEELVSATLPSLTNQASITRYDPKNIDV